MATLDEIKELNAWELSEDYADCAKPDTSGSPGAELLLAVRDRFVSWVEANPEGTPDDARDASSDELDGVVSIYTYMKWKQFVDLAAWQEEPESGEWPDDLDKASDIALWQIADRCWFALVQAWEDGLAEETEDEEEDE